MKILSLGWGVQSWTLAAMSALGELEKVDLAIHSDTTWERSETYEFAKEWTGWLKERGIKVITVSDAEQAARVSTYATDIPAFTLKDGKKGMLYRQCTQRWKIVPARRAIRKEMKKRGISLKPNVIEQWFGITLDEKKRVTESDVKYIKHRYPLLEKEFSRDDCKAWLQANNLPIPVKSACIFCPYRKNDEWKRMRDSDLQAAIEVDEAIRNARSPYKLYIHSSRKPLLSMS